MSRMACSTVSIQTSAPSVPSAPCWFGEVAVVAHDLSELSGLETIAEQVRFARRRFGHYDVIDFVAILIGSALSGEATLETFYDRLLPFATPFRALFGRKDLPHRSTLSRFLAALDQPTVEALRAVFRKDLVARPLTQEGLSRGGIWDRQRTHWLVFDLELGHHLHPTPMRTTEFAPVITPSLPAPLPDSTPSVTYGPPEWARPARVGSFAGTDFTEPPDGTLRSPTARPLSAQERRAERDGTLRMVSAARRGHCRACPVRERCQEHGTQTRKPRRVRAVLRPIEGPPPPAREQSPPKPSTQPILWGDWSRCQTRRA